LQSSSHSSPRYGGCRDHTQHTCRVWLVLAFLKTGDNQRPPSSHLYTADVPPPPQTHVSKGLLDLCWKAPKEGQGGPCSWGWSTLTNT
jgi:hypothetical protein